MGKPHVWTVDVTNKTDVREAVRAILQDEVVIRKQALKLYLDVYRHTPSIL